jgi:hypothetical protein
MPDLQDRRMSFEKASIYALLIPHSARSRSIQISEPDTSSEKDDSVDSIPSPEVSLMTGDGQECEYWSQRSGFQCFKILTYFSLGISYGL